MQCTVLHCTALLCSALRSEADFVLLCTALLCTALRSEADKQAEEVDKKEAGVQLELEGEEHLVVTSSNHSLLTINALGIIQMANKVR